MTVTANDGWIQYTGDGTDATLAVDFEFYDDTDLLVTQRITATGVDVVMVEGTDYTVTGGDGSTGSVVIGTGVGVLKFTTAHTWTISRLEPDTIETNVTSQEAIPSSTLNKQLDRVLYNIQEHSEKLGRALIGPVSDPAAGRVGALPNSVDRAGKYLAFDVNGAPTASAALTGTGAATYIPVSATEMTVSGAAAAGSIGGRTTPSIVFTDASSSQFCYFNPSIIQTIGGGDITAITFTYVMAVGNGSDEVRLGFSMAANQPGVDLDTGATGDEATFAVDDNAQWLNRSTIEVTSGFGTFAGADAVYLKFYRDGGHAGDTASGDMHLLDILITLVKS